MGHDHNSTISFHDLANDSYKYLYGSSTGPEGRISQHTASGYETFLGNALGSVQQLVDNCVNSYHAMVFISIEDSSVSLMNQEKPNYYQWIWLK